MLRIGVIFIAHYHYKLHQEGLRYSHTIPRHPVGLMQHLSSGWSVFTLLWWGKMSAVQCSSAYNHLEDGTARRCIQNHWWCLSQSAHIYTVSWPTLSTWVVLFPLMITYYHKYTHYWTRVHCLTVILLHTYPKCSQLNVHNQAFSTFFYETTIHKWFDVFGCSAEFLKTWAHKHTNFSSC